MLQKLENALLDLFSFTALLLSLIKSGVENGNKLSKTNKDQSKKIRSPRRHHFSDCFANLFCQIGTQLADHLKWKTTGS